jgi:hypothetical protein
MSVFDAYTLPELKLVYQILHQQLPDHMDLMDGAFLHDLQTQLQQLAKKDGVDVSLHAEWANWLEQRT